MGKKVILEVRQEVLRRARLEAERTSRRVEDVLAQWLNRYAEEEPLETLSDEQVLALCRFEMNLVQRQEMTTLLHYHQQGTLDERQSARLDELLQLHRRGVVRKARALRVAAARGILPPQS